MSTRLGVGLAEVGSQRAESEILRGKRELNAKQIGAVAARSTCRPRCSAEGLKKAADSRCRLAIHSSK